MTLFDKDGNPVAYIEIEDENTIYLWDGTPVAYLYSENIYGFNGKHLGWFGDGVIRNHEGEKCGFTGSNVPVATKLEPFKSFKQFKPFKSFKEFAPFKPFDSWSTSSLLLKDFLRQGQ